MRKQLRRRGQSDEDADINLTPMLDVVFIMLIFFIVTATFIKEVGLDVNQPDDDKPKTVDPDKKSILRLTFRGEVVEAKEEPAVGAVAGEGEEEEGNKQE